MELTYKVTEKGYIIFNNGQAWIEQKSYIPYPADTMKESAQNHIDKLLEGQNAPQPDDEIEQLRNDLNEAVMELSLLVAMGGNS